MEAKQKILIAIRVLWLCRNTLLVFKHSGRKETSRWHTKYFECVCVCLWVCVCAFSGIWDMRFPMWHYVDIHDQLICLTSSLYSQMDPSLEPFSNQPPAPAKLSIFTISNILFLVNKLQKLDWNQSMYEDLHADTTLHFSPPIKTYTVSFLRQTAHIQSVSLKNTYYKSSRIRQVK